MVKRLLIILIIPLTLVACLASGFPYLIISQLSALPALQLSVPGEPAASPEKAGFGMDSALAVHPLDLPLPAVVSPTLRSMPRSRTLHPPRPARPRGVLPAHPFSTSPICQPHAHNHRKGTYPAAARDEPADRPGHRRPKPAGAARWGSRSRFSPGTPARSGGFRWPTWLLNITWNTA